MDIISKLQIKAKEENLFNRRLKVNIVYHLQYIYNIAGEYLAAIKAVKPNSSYNIRFYLLVKGG